VVLRIERYVFDLAMGYSWLFPLSYVLSMVSGNVIQGTMAASVGSVQSAFPDETFFVVNLVNFIYYWMYLVIGPTVPGLNRRLKRGHMMMLATTTMLAGQLLMLLQSYGFWWLLTGIALTNLPQPVLASSLADTLGEYVPEKREARLLGLYVCIQNAATGLAYVGAVWYLGSGAQFQTNFASFVIAAAAIQTAALALAILHAALEPEDAATCLGDEDNGRRIHLPPVSRTRQIQPLTTADARVFGDLRIKEPMARWVFGVFVAAYAIQNALGNVLALLFNEVETDRNLGVSSVTEVVFAVGAASLLAPPLVGEVADQIQSWLLLPWFLVFGQTLVQTAFFYWTASPSATVGALAAFAAVNSSLTTTFLPALVRIPAGISRGATNVAMSWTTNLFTALGNLLTLQSGNLVPTMRPIFLALGTTASAATAIASITAKNI
jgi:hypothetical protein